MSQFSQSGASIPTAPTTCYSSLVASISIEVNGSAREMPARSTVADLLAALDLADRPVAVERNREIVPRAFHAHTQLAAGDRLELVTLVGGG